MGSVVKSIGKVIKKIGKGIKKVIKKIGPALLIAAAVYAGVAFYGASVTGVSGIGASNFTAGLQTMGQKLMGFFSPTGTAQAANVAGQAGAGAAQAVGAGMTGAELFTGYTGQAGVGAAATQAGASVIKRYAGAVAGGMTSGDALVYMTKMNMLATGAKMVAGFFDKSEEEQRQHEKELLSQRYAFGKPMTDEQKAFKAANPDWISEHPAMQRQDLYSSPNQMQTQMYANLPSQTTTPSPYVMQQTIGQPTFGRQGTREYGTAAPTAFAGTKKGLITKGTQSVFNPNQTRRFA
jgi:hypothetical protein